MTTRNDYLIHIGGNHTGKAVLYHANRRAGSKLFRQELLEFLKQFGFASYVTVERVRCEDGAVIRKGFHAGPCTIVNA